MKRKLKWTLLAVMILLVISTALLNSPKLRTALFVHSYSERIEDSIEAGNGRTIPSTPLLGYQYVNHWEGEHEMAEFVIGTLGDTYYGCYYSPDDVPLAFQNTVVELLPDGEGRWTWSTEGDTHGVTSKIKENWYSFQASF